MSYCSNNCSHPFREFSQGLEFDPNDLLIKVLQELSKADIFFLLEITPKLYNIFCLTGNMLVLKELISNIDCSQIYRLVWKIYAKEFEVFDLRIVFSQITESLTWDSFEQQNFWVLLNAQFVGSKELNNMEVWVQKLLEISNSGEHPEATIGFINLCNQVNPTSYKTLIPIFLNFTYHKGGAQLEPEDLPVFIPIFFKWQKQQNFDIILKSFESNLNSLQNLECWTKCFENSIKSLP
jgi:hypothetical protein